MPLVPLLWLPIAPRGAEVVLLVWAQFIYAGGGDGGGGAAAARWHHRTASLNSSHTDLPACLHTPRCSNSCNSSPRRSTTMCGSQCLGLHRWGKWASASGVGHSLLPAVRGGMFERGARARARMHPMLLLDLWAQLTARLCALPLSTAGRGPAHPKGVLKMR